MGRPLRRARAAPSAKVWFPYSCASAHMTYREGVAGRKVPLRRVAEDAIAAVDREERSFSLQTFVCCCEGTSEVTLGLDVPDFLSME